MHLVLYRREEQASTTMNWTYGAKWWVEEKSEGQSCREGNRGNVRKLETNLSDFR
jgi:hypothetical protein